MFISIHFHQLTFTRRIGFPVANALYDIFVAYESPPANSNFGVRLNASLNFCVITFRSPQCFSRVYWKSVGSSRVEDDVPLEVIPASYLHSADDVTGNGYYSTAGHASRVVAVEPGATCSSFSYASGSAITLATAGTAATFTVTVKDSWDNLKTSTSSTIITASIVQQGSFNLQAAATPTAVASSPTYTVTYTLTASSLYSLAVQCNNQGIIGSAFSLTVFPSNECGTIVLAHAVCSASINVFGRLYFFLFRPWNLIFHYVIIVLIFNILYVFS